MRNRVVAALVALGVLFAAACGGPQEPPPDLVVRNTTSPGEIDPIVAEEVIDFVDPDAGLGDPVTIDCCVVPFALAREEGEVAADLLIHAQRHRMGVSDAGVWYVDACIGLSSDEYNFQVALPTDDDAGVLWVDRVNPAVPMKQGSTSPEPRNIFEAPDGGTCETFDGGLYATVPDAGA